MRMPDSESQDTNKSLLPAILLIERQYESARVWSYEWIIISLVAVFFLIVISFFAGCLINLMTLISFYIILLVGAFLSYRERKAQIKLEKIGYQNFRDYFGYFHKGKYKFKGNINSDEFT